MNETPTVETPPVPTEDQLALLQAGENAAQFLQYLKDNPFFKQLVESLDAEYVREILGLASTDTEKFRDLQTKRQALYEPFARVQTFLHAAQKVTEELQGIESPGGIL